MPTIFLFVISSIIFFGAIGAVVAIVISGGLIISNLPAWQELFSHTSSLANMCNIGKEQHFF